MQCIVRRHGPQIPPDPLLVPLDLLALRAEPFHLRRPRRPQLHQPLQPEQPRHRRLALQQRNALPRDPVLPHRVPRASPAFSDTANRHAPAVSSAGDRAGSGTNVAVGRLRISISNSRPSPAGAVTTTCVVVRCRSSIRSTPCAAVTAARLAASSCFHTTAVRKSSANDSNRLSSAGKPPSRASPANIAGDAGSYSVKTPAGRLVAVSLVSRIDASGCGRPCCASPIRRAVASRSRIGNVAVCPAASVTGLGKANTVSCAPSVAAAASAGAAITGAGARATSAAAKFPAAAERGALGGAGDAAIATTGADLTSTPGRIRPKTSTGTSGRCTK